MPCSTREWESGRLPLQPPPPPTATIITTRTIPAFLLFELLVRKGLRGFASDEEEAAPPRARLWLLVS